MSIIRKFIYIIVIVFSILLSPITSAAEQAKEVNQLQLISVPDPLELNANWWKSFECSAEEFSQKASRLKENLETLKGSLTEEEHKEIHEIIDRLYLNLDRFKGRKAQTTTETTTTLQFLPSYSVEQLLKVNKNYHQTRISLTNEQKKLESETIHLKRVSNKLDELILTYQSFDKSSYEKLKTGLRIMEKRTEFELAEVESSNIKKKIEHFKKEQERLGEELKIAQNNITFGSISPEEAKQQWQQATLYHQKTKRQLNSLEKNAFYTNTQKPSNELTCCLADYKVLAQSINTEVAGIQALNREIIYYFYQMSTRIRQYTTVELQELLKEWKRKSTEISTNMQHWEQVIKTEQARLGRWVSGELLNDSGGSVPEASTVADIHKELDKAQASIQDLQLNLQNLELFYSQIERYLIKEKKLTETWAIVTRNYADTAMETITDWGNVTLFHIHDSPVTPFRLLQILVIMIGAVMFSRLTNKVLFQRKYFSSAISQSTEYIIARCVHYVFTIVAVFIALSYLGLDFTNFVIVAGALGVGIGFGLQTMVNNILSGFLLLFQRNIKVNDIVELEKGLFGRVMGINLQNTRIRTFDGIDLIVPNNQLTSKMINNWTMGDHCRRFRVPFSVAYGTDIVKVKNCVTEAVSKIPSTISGDPKYHNPQVWMKGFGDNSLELELVAWVDLTIRMPEGGFTSNLNWAIEAALRENDISIPFPQRDIYIKEFPKSE